MNVRLRCVRLSFISINLSDWLGRTHLQWPFIQFVAVLTWCMLWPRVFTNKCYIKTVKQIIIETVPHNSLGTIYQSPKINGSPLTGTWGVVKICNFRQILRYVSKLVQAHWLNGDLLLSCIIFFLFYLCDGATVILTDHFKLW